MIGKMCFSGSGIEEFLAPSSLREIGQNAFENCKNLKHIALNEGLEKLVTDDGDRAEDTSHGDYDMFDIFGRNRTLAS